MFSDRLLDATIQVSSPDGTITLTAKGDGRVDVELDRDALRCHSDESFQEQLQACVLSGLRASRRVYMQTRRSVFADEAGTTTTDPEEVDDA